MARQSNFLTTSDLRDLRAITMGDADDPSDFVTNLRRLTERDPRLSGLFAEPVFTRTDSGELVSATWYTGYDREARRFSQAPGPLQERVSAVLKDVLPGLVALFDDPEVGALAQVMANVPSLDSVYCVGNQPVLINWGLVDRNEAVDDPSARAQKLFSAFLPSEQDPSQSGPRGTVVGAAAGAAATGAAISTFGSGDAKAQSEATDTSEISAEAANSTSGTGSSTQGAAVAETAVAAGAAAVVVDETPFYHRLWFRLALYAGLLLLIAWLIWFLLYGLPYGLLVRPPAAAEVQGSVTEGLERERDRLLRLLEDPCSPAAAEAVDRGDITGRLVPPAPVADPEGQRQNPDVADGEDTRPSVPSEPPPASGGAQPIALEALAQRLEKSVVFIFGPVSDGAAMGTGFFVSGDTIVTNRHVVEQIDPEKLFITSKALGQVYPARIVSMTSDSRIGTADYAVLKLASSLDIYPLELHPDVPKLARVVTAGYPGFITQHDPARDALFRGDSTAAPEIVFAGGEVNVVQRRPSGPSIVIHTAEMSQGNSGGPLVDQCGRVVGINTFIGQDEASGRRGLYSLGAEDLIRFLRSAGVSPAVNTVGCGTQAPGPAAEPTQGTE